MSNDLVIEDLNGNEVFRGSLFNNGYPGDPDETADEIFDCLLEEEGWVEDHLTTALGSSIEFIEIDYSDRINKNMSAKIKLYNNGALTHTVSLKPSNGSGITQTLSTTLSPPVVSSSGQTVAIPQTLAVPAGSSNLPTGNPDTFLGEIEDMDLSALYGKMFGVAIGTGKRNSKSFIGSTLLAPLDFYEMVEAVAGYYEREQIHAKAFILSKDINERMKYLDECTIDFIEARSMDILADGMLSGALSDKVEYTCQAGFLADEEEQVDTDPQ